MSDNTRTSRENIDNASVYADTSRDVADKGRHDAGSVGKNAKGARVVADTQRTFAPNGGEYARYVSDNAHNLCVIARHAGSDVDSLGENTDNTRVKK